MLTFKTKKVWEVWKNRSFLQANLVVLLCEPVIKKKAKRKHVEEYDTSQQAEEIYNSKNFAFGNIDPEIIVGPEISKPILKRKNADPYDVFEFEEEGPVKSEHEKNKNLDTFDFENTFLEETTISSEKSFSMLEPEGSRKGNALFSKNVMRFPPANVEEDEDDFLNDSRKSALQKKADKSVQTGNFAIAYENENAPKENAIFMESLTKLKNYVVHYLKNSERQKFVTSIKSYFRVPVSGNIVERCKSFDTIEANSVSNTFDCFCEKVDGKVLQNVLKRLKQSEKPIKRNEAENKFRNCSYFDFGNDLLLNRFCSARKDKTGVDIYEENVFKKSVATVLTWIENEIKRDPVYLGLVWKNSQAVNGMNILNQILECDSETTYVRTSIFHFFKNILDSFDNFSSTYQNRDLEFRASFVTVTCESPTLYLDLIQYCVEKLLYSKRLQQSSGSGSNKKWLILYVERHFVLYRLLKNLLEKLGNDLTVDMPDLSTNLGKDENSLPDISWKMPSFEKKSLTGKDENFATVIDRLLRSLSELLSFSKSKFPLSAVVVSECHVLIRDIHRATLNICKLPVKDRKYFNFYSCTF